MRRDPNWFYVEKYGLTSQEAVRLGALDRLTRDELIDRVEAWRMRNGYPLSASPLTRGFLLDELSRVEV